MNDLENERKILDLQKQGELKKAELLAAYESREEKHLKDKKRLIYHLDFDIEKLEMRLERATGTGAVDKVEMDKKQKIIDDLEKVFNDKMQINKLLQSQIASLEVKVFWSLKVGGLFFM